MKPPPTFDEIARRAYGLWEAEGRPAGKDDEHWRRAEIELGGDERRASDAPQAATMQAMRIHTFGGPEVMRLDEVPTPLPGRDEVLIKVSAASVNPVDYKIRSGEFKPPGLTLPTTLGRDVAGVVRQVGSAVTGVRVGDEVYAMLDWDHGGYAQYAVAKGASVAPKPARLTPQQAAAVPLAALTAWQALFDQGGLKAGERVLIHGAAGGVGHFAVQFAKARGARVLATARAEDEAALRGIGADEVIDYRAGPFENKVRDIDVVLDLIDGETQRRSWAVLKRGGRLVSTLRPPDPAEAKRHGAIGRHLMTKPSGSQLREIGALIDEGQVRVLIDEALPFSQADRAHRHAEHDHIRGKLVLTVAA